MTTLKKPLSVNAKEQDTLLFIALAYGLVDRKSSKDKIVFSANGYWMTHIDITGDDFLWGEHQEFPHRKAVFWQVMLMTLGII